jgi:transglutaminase-like putative cysteine protease
MEAGGQRCLAFSLVTEPHGEVLRYADRCGNDVRHFDTLFPHQKLVVSAISEVITPANLIDEQRELSPLDQYDYLMATGYAPDDAVIRGFAASQTAAASPSETARQLMAAIFNRLKYEPGATDVKTTADEALELGRGVCQDFAHLMLAACRCRGLPARYVSGYLYGPNNGANAASHAWVDVFTERGWLSFDPTHNTQQTDHYVRVAVGRDYADVPPTRGVFKGNATEALEVNVKVQTI